MVSTYDTSVGGTVQAPPIVQQLETVFAKLDDEPLLKALIGPTRRGPKGHPARTLWHCFVAKYILSLPSTRALIRTLENNPFIAQVCGVTGPVPHEATFSRFFSKLAKRKYLHLVKDVSRRLTQRCYQELPGFGQRVALDSTVLKGWVNGGKRKPSDPEARWAVKKNTHGKTEFTLGYKLHLAVDCEYELPIAASVSPGNAHDGPRASYLLAEARYTCGKFHPKYVIADKAYSGKPLMRLIQRQYRATPIIQINKVHKKLLAEFGELQQSPEWKGVYAQRGAVERVNSRLKGQRSLNSIRVRRLMKVTVHCYLALIAMQCSWRQPLPTACAEVQVAWVEQTHT